MVPYEKGSTFLWYLEDLVGGAAVFEPFLKSYYNNFAYKSIDSDQFKDFFLEKFSSLEVVKEIDWETWLQKPGMPIYKVNLDGKSKLSISSIICSFYQSDLERVLICNSSISSQTLTTLLLELAGTWLPPGKVVNIFSLLLL